jgi:hypothetical protein
VHATHRKIRQFVLTRFVSAGEMALGSSITAASL